MGFAYTGDGLKENLLGVTDKARGKRTRSFMAAWRWLWHKSKRRNTDLKFRRTGNKKMCKVSASFVDRANAV
jgi:hypothetical protein